eukprot:1871107-Alexandrium_andersonii.AAC.1
MPGRVIWPGSGGRACIPEGGGRCPPLVRRRRPARRVSALRRRGSIHWAGWSKRPGRPEGEGPVWPELLLD